MSGELRSLLAGTFGLTVLGLVALVLTLGRRPASASPGSLRGVLAVFAAGLVCQALHFGEELASGFHRRFPEQLGLSLWSAAAFVGFNLFWLAVWIFAAFGLRRHFRIAVWPVWFFALAMTANGIAHPLLALRSGGYFPGLWTAPLVGIAGVLLLVKLWQATAPQEAAGGGG
jgi:hypothetical protein